MDTDLECWFNSILSTERISCFGWGPFSSLVQLPNYFLWSDIVLLPQLSHDITSVGTILWKLWFESIGVSKGGPHIDQIRFLVISRPFIKMKDEFQNKKIYMLFLILEAYVINYMYSILIYYSRQTDYKIEFEVNYINTINWCWWEVDPTWYWICERSKLLGGLFHVTRWCSLPLCANYPYAFK